VSWRDLCGAKLVSVDAAIDRICSGSTVAVAPYNCTPHTLCSSLEARARQTGLENIRIEHFGAQRQWTAPDLRSAFLLKDNYATPLNRAACHAGTMEYLPVAAWRSHSVPAGLTVHPDFFLVPVSPPDSDGICSFGPGVWFSPTMVRNARCVIAEIQPDFIRTGGENRVHVDEINFFVEGETRPDKSPDASAGPDDPELAAAVDVICSLVAAELVEDGNTIQIGVGKVSTSVGRHLDFRNDLGVHTELITSGIPELVRRGVVNGKYKTLHPGKVVGSALAELTADELELIDGNPAFELYDFGYTDDLRQLLKLESFVAVNNALAVDLTGQVAAEGWDHRPYTGVGGQTVFMIAGAYSDGGRSVSVLPSSSLPSGGGGRVSRIVPFLAPGTPVTVPRTFVDYVVTEQGIAELRGKTVAERARALCEVAHPDFADELRARAQELYHA
jgi:4-hydroxybutyrate CoA-transferase